MPDKSTPDEILEQSLPASDAAGVGYMTGDDPSEDIDEAALMYVIGYEGPAAGETPASWDAYMGDMGNAVADTPDTPDGPDGSDVTTDAIQDTSLGTAADATQGGTPSEQEARSWRDVAREGDVEARASMAAARNERLLASLWCRLFPIDYDAIPTAAYVVVDEASAHGIPTIEAATGELTPSQASQEADGTTPSIQSVAGAAVAAGLGAGAGAIAAIRGLVHGSDTSNEDTVMIGNEALSEMLTARRQAAAEASEDAGEDGGSADEVALPTELESLYNEAMNAFTEADSPSSSAETEADGTTAESPEDTEEPWSDDLVAPSDAESIETVGASDDYRPDAGGDDIYKSEEWHEIEQEIAEANLAVATGLDRLDMLAGIAPTGPEQEPVEEAEEAAADALPHEETQDDASYGDSDAVDDASGADDEESSASAGSSQDDETEDVADDLDRLAPDVVPDEPSDVASGEDVAKNEGTEQAEEEGEPVAEDQAHEHEEQEGTIPAFLERLTGLFRRKEKAEPSDSIVNQLTDVAEEGEPEPDEPLPTSGEPDTYGTQDALDGDQTADYDGSAGYDAADYESNIKLAEREEPADEPQAYAGGATVPMPIGDVAEALDEEWDDDAPIVVGEDYRTPFPEADDLDDVIAAVDDAPSQTAPEGSTSGQTVPMEGAYEEEPAVEEPTRAQGVLPHRPSRAAGIRIGRERIDSLRMDVSQDLMLPLPKASNGQIDANIKVKTTEFLTPKRAGVGARSSHIKLSVRPSKVRLGAISVLPEGRGYLPEQSPIGTRPPELASYDYEPVRRIGEPLAE